MPSTTQLWSTKASQSDQFHGEDLNLHGVSAASYEYLNYVKRKTRQIPTLKELLFLLPFVCFEDTEENTGFRMFWPRTINHSNSVLRIFCWLTGPWKRCVTASIMYMACPSSLGQASISFRHPRWDLPMVLGMAMVLCKNNNKLCHMFMVTSKRWWK